MTMPRYLELIPETFASPEELQEFHQTVDVDGWTVDYVAPGQYVRPDMPVNLSMVRMRDNSDPHARQRAAMAEAYRMSPQQALHILLERWERLTNQRNPRARTSARFFLSRPPRDRRAFMQQGLHLAGRIPPQDMNLIDPGFILRLAIYGASFLPERMRFLAANPNRASLRMAALRRTPAASVRAPMQMAAEMPAPMLGSGNTSAFQSRRRKRRPDLDPAPGFADAI